MITWCDVKCYYMPHSKDKGKTTLIARFMGPTWGPSGADRTQVGPMLAPLTLLSGPIIEITIPYLYIMGKLCEYCVKYWPCYDETCLLYKPYIKRRWYFQIKSRIRYQAYSGFQQTWWRCLWHSRASFTSNNITHNFMYFVISPPCFNFNRIVISTYIINKL